MKKYLIALMIVFLCALNSEAAHPWLTTRASTLVNSAGAIFYVETKAPYKCKKHGEIHEVVPIPLQGREYVFCLHCMVGGLRAAIGEVEEVKEK